MFRQILSRGMRLGAIAHSNAALRAYREERKGMSKDFLVYRKIYWRNGGHIPPKWHVHHCNGNKRDHRFDNLIALPESIHAHVHNKMNGSLPGKKKLRTYFFKKDGSLNDSALKIHEKHEAKKAARKLKKELKRAKRKELAKQQRIQEAKWRQAREQAPSVVLRKRVE